MKKFKCYLGAHNFMVVAVNHEYFTNWTDVEQQEHWFMRFYVCKCGKRKFTTDHSGYSKHKGIEQAKLNWLELGHIPTNSYDPVTKIIIEGVYETPVIQEATVIPFEIVEGGKD